MNAIAEEVSKMGSNSELDLEKALIVTRRALSRLQQLVSRTGTEVQQAVMLEVLKTAAREQEDPLYRPTLSEPERGYDA